MNLKEIAEKRELLEIGRKAVEETLIDWRDNRLSELMRNNGCVVKEKDGTASDIIRFGPETCIAIGLKAIAAHLDSKGESGK